MVDLIKRREEKIKLRWLWNYFNTKGKIKLWFRLKLAIELVCQVLSSFKRFFSLLHEL